MTPHPTLTAAPVTRPPPAADRSDRSDRLRAAVARACGTAVAAVGAIVLLGWAADIPALTSVVPGFATMKANTAALLVLCGLAVRTRRPAAGVAAGAVAAVAGLTLAEHVFAIDFGIDRLLARHAADAGPHPGRMAVVTAGLFLGTAAALLFRGRRVAPGLAVGVLLTAGLSALTYLFGATGPGVPAAFAGVAVHTAGAFLVLAAGLLADDPRDHVFALLADPCPGGRLVRRMLPAAVAVPVGFAFARLAGQRLGWYGTEFGLALFALSNVAVFAALTVWSAARVRAANAALERTVADRTAALRESERRFRAIFHSQFQFIGLMAPDGTLTEANRTALAAAGVAEADVLGRPFWDTGWWAHDAAQQERLRRAVARAAGGTQDRFEAHHPAAAGGLMWVDFSLTPFRDDDGRVALLIPEGRDITDRKRAEAELRESEERFRSAFENAPIGIALVAPDGRWLRVNRAICDLVGYPEAELLATDFQTITHPADLDADLALVGEVLAGTRATYRMEKRYVHKRGHVVHVLLSVSLVRDRDGRPAYFVSQVQDVTEQKQAELALRASDERFRAFMDHLPLAAWATDAGGRLAVSNRFLAAMLRRDPHEIAGKTRFDLLDPDTARAHEANDRRVRETGAAVELEEHYVRPDGTPGVTYSVKFPVRGADGATLVGGVALDVTERKRAEERVAASLREKEVLLKEIHHRVKNNLQIISALLDLQSGYTDDRQVLELFRESRGRVRSMALVHERLYRSADVARVPFAGYVSQLADDLVRAYQVTDDVRLDLDVTAPPLPIDVAIPCGLLLNELLSNCFKHAFAGGRAGAVRVAMSRRYDANVLTVADDGPGFPPGFDPHRTASFGMQLVCTLVEQLGGEFECRSAGGAEITVRFPATIG